MEAVPLDLKEMLAMVNNPIPFYMGAAAVVFILLYWFVFWLRLCVDAAAVGNGATFRAGLVLGVLSLVADFFWRAYRIAPDPVLLVCVIFFGGVPWAAVASFLLLGGR